MESAQTTLCLVTAQFSQARSSPWRARWTQSTSFPISGVLLIYPLQAIWQMRVRLARYTRPQNWNFCYETLDYRLHLRNETNTSSIAYGAALPQKLGVAVTLPDFFSSFVLILACVQLARQCKTWLVSTRNELDTCRWFNNWSDRYLPLAFLALC